MPFYSLIEPLLKSTKGQIVSIIGGGGKSSLLQRIGRELAEQKLKVILTSTTKIEPFPNTGIVLLEGNQNFQSELSYILDDLKITLVAQDHYSKEKLLGINPQIVSKLKTFADIILIEADGSRQRPLKTHQEDEPVIPRTSDMVIIVVGADAVGQNLNDKNVHRAELFSQKWKLKLGTKLTPEIIAEELVSPQGYLRKIPLGCDVSIFVNKSDLNLEGGTFLAKRLKKKCNYPVFLGSAKENSILALNSAQIIEGFSIA